MTAQTPIQKYRALLQSRRLLPDVAQAHAAEALDDLYQALKTYRPRSRRVLGFGLRSAPIAPDGDPDSLDWRAIARRTASQFAGFCASETVPPKGLYIHGDVGRGKSILMDIFFAGAPTARKRRVHFNAFMIETHKAIHEWRNLSPRDRSQRPEFVREAGDDPIAPAANRILAQATLLCLDEFQVTDVADAMILGRLFEKLFASGGVIVLTSNTPPDRLYEGGLNRQLFLPFIALIKARLETIELNGPRDYRLEGMAGLSVYNTPLGPEADKAMDAAWQRLTGSERGQSLALDVMERKLFVPQAARGAARFSFDALCGNALGAADYLALARNFHTVLIDNIPRLGPEKSNEARRFTLLIDTLYDQKVRLICSAAVPPQLLYGSGDNAQAFRRAESRLVEMQGAAYLASDLRNAAAVT